MAKGYNELTRDELLTLEQELQKFYVTKRLSSGKTIRILDRERWLISKGCKKNPGDYTIAWSPTYAFHDDQLQQLSAYRARREFARMMSAREAAAAAA